MNRRYAVPDVAAHIASGRVENNILFGKHAALRVTCFPKRMERGHLFPKNLLPEQIFWEKTEQGPCCRRRIGLPSGETSGLNTPTAYVVSLTARRLVIVVLLLSG